MIRSGGRGPSGVTVAAVGAGGTEVLADPCLRAGRHEGLAAIERGYNGLAVGGDVMLVLRPIDRSTSWARIP